MGKVELTLQEYNDLVNATTQALNDKLAIKRECDSLIKALNVLKTQNNKLVGEYLENRVYVWTHAFKEDEPITNENLDKYVHSAVWDLTDLTREEILKGVQYLYAKHIGQQ